MNFDRATLEQIERPFGFRERKLASISAQEVIFTQTSAPMPRPPEPESPEILHFAFAGVVLPLLSVTACVTTLMEGNPRGELHLFVGFTVIIMILAAWSWDTILDSRDARRALDHWERCQGEIGMVVRFSRRLGTCTLEGPCPAGQLAGPVIVRVPLRKVRMGKQYSVPPPWPPAPDPGARETSEVAFSLDLSIDHAPVPQLGMHFDLLAGLEGRAGDHAGWASICDVEARAREVRVLELLGRASADDVTPRPGW